MVFFSKEKSYCRDTAERGGVSPGAATLPYPIQSCVSRQHTSTRLSLMRAPRLPLSKPCSQITSIN